MHEGLALLALTWRGLLACKPHVRRCREDRSSQLLPFVNHLELSPSLCGQITEMPGHRFGKGHGTTALGAERVGAAAAVLMEELLCVEPERTIPSTKACAGRRAAAASCCRLPCGPKWITPSKTEANCTSYKPAYPVSSRDLPLYGWKFHLGLFLVQPG